MGPAESGRGELPRPHHRRPPAGPDQNRVAYAAQIQEDSSQSYTEGLIELVPNGTVWWSRRQ